jgi:hypothetical protein
VTVVDYQTKDGLAEFGFSVEFQPNIGWRVYIIFDPFHWGRDHDTDLPYQSVDHAGRRYVNWSSKIDTLGEAKTVAGIWAELTQRAQRERAAHVELIQRHLNTEKQKRPPASAQPKTMVNAGEAGPGNQHHAPTVPGPRCNRKETPISDHSGR